MGWLTRLFGAGPEAPARFAIEWPGEGGLRSEVKGARLLLTDVGGLTARDLEVIRAGAGRDAPLVLVTPGLESPAIDLLDGRTLLAVKATSLEGQDLVDLVEDLALFTGGIVCSQELGYGLPPDALRVNRDSRSKIRLPDLSWANLTAAQLGRAVSVRIDDTGTVVQSSLASKSVGSRLQMLEHQIAPPASPDVRAGCLRRAQRLGETTSLGGAAGRATPAPALRDQVECRLGSRYFLTDGMRGRCVLENAVTCVADFDVTEVNDVLRPLNLAAQGNRPLALFARSVSGAALATMVVNKLQGIVLCAALCPVSSGDGASAVLAEVARRTGAAVLTDPSNEQEEGDLGKLRLLEASPGSCRIT